MPELDAAVFVDGEPTCFFKLLENRSVYIPEEFDLTIYDVNDFVGILHFEHHPDVAFVAELAKFEHQIVENDVTWLAITKQKG